MEQDFLQQTEHHSQSSQGFEDLPDVKVYADSISSPGDSGVLSCNNSIYSSSGFTPCTPGSTPDVNSNPACSSESRHQFGMNKEHGMSTESVSATSGSPTPSPEEGTFEMPRPFILPSDAAAAASANQQQAHPSAFKPYLPKPLVLPNTLQELTMPSTRSSTDSDPRGNSNPESISSNHSSGRNSIINSLRNSMASSESSNYSIVSEHSNLSAGQDSQQFLQQNTLRDTDSDSFSASLTPTARMKKYEDSGRRNSVPSVGSSPTSLTVRPKTGSQTQTPVSECSGTRFRPQSAKTNYDMCVLCDKQCNNFLMHEWRGVPDSFEEEGLKSVDSNSGEKSH